MRKNLLRGLSAKLLVVIGIGLLVGLSSLGWIKLQHDSQSVYRIAQISGQQRIAWMAKSLSGLLANQDYNNLVAFTQSMVSAPDVLVFRVSDRDGKVIIERTRSNLGRQHPSLSFHSPILSRQEKIGSVEMRIATSGLETAIQESWRGLVAWSALVLLFLAVLVYWASSVMVHAPVVRIRNRMQEIVANPEAELQNVELPGSDELADLARTFNQVQRAWQAQRQHLEQRALIAEENLARANQELVLRSKELEHMVTLSQQLATTDNLTGLHNRRFLDENLASVFALAKRHGDPLCLMLLDVDHFKLINDEYGHASGDEVLKLLALLIRFGIRDSDISARMGGDEFALVLPRTLVKQGQLFAAGLLDKIRAREFILPNGKKLSVTLSIGIVGLSDDIQSMEALYGAADRALYESKHRGRNQVTCIYQDKFLDQAVEYV